MKRISVCIGIGYLLIQKRKKMGMIFEPIVHSICKPCVSKIIHVKENGMDGMEYTKEIIAKDQRFSLPGQSLRLLLFLKRNFSN